MTLLEVLIVCALLIMLAALAVVPNYRAYERHRAASDAALRLAADIALLERTAQNDGLYGGATLRIVSAQPLSYAGYRGRPQELNVAWQQGPLLLQREFAGVELAPGAVTASGALLFARNGSAQFVARGSWVNQHQTIELVVASAEDAQRTAVVELNLFTGALAVR
jgi:hypothetical protein